MAWPTELAEVEARIWSELARAVPDRRHSWRTLALATVTPEGEPRVRSVVLRWADREQGVVEIHSDRRTQKIEDLSAQPRVELLAWDPETSVQIRILGPVGVHYMDDVAEQRWRNLDTYGYTIYRARTAPGTVVPEPMGIDVGLSPEEAFRGFVVLRVQVTRLDWLELARGGHRRAQFLRSPTGKIASDWLAP